MTARIYKPARTAMQSGHAKTKEWLLDYEPENVVSIGLTAMPAATVMAGAPPANENPPTSASAPAARRYREPRCSNAASSDR